MARYTRRRRRSTYRSGSYRRGYTGYSRRRTTRRRRGTARGGRTARVVIQVVGGAAGVAASPVAIGMKGSRPVRARY